MTQPFDRGHRASPPGKPDSTLGEFWEPNLFDIPRAHNLSAYERNRFYLQRDGKFADHSFLSGTDSDGDGRSAVSADFDGDGKLDLLVRQAGGAPIQLFRNEMPDTGNHLTLSFDRPPLGARITIRHDGKIQTRQVFPHNTHRSQSPLRQHFGLGASKKIEDLTIIWPDGKTETFRNLPSGSFHLK